MDTFLEFKSKFLKPNQILIKSYPDLNKIGFRDLNTIRSLYHAYAKYSKHFHILISYTMFLFILFIFFLFFYSSLFADVFYYCSDNLYYLLNIRPLTLNNTFLAVTVTIITIIISCFVAVVLLISALKRYPKEQAVFIRIHKDFKIFMRDNSRKDIPSEKKNISPRLLFTPPKYKKLKLLLSILFFQISIIGPLFLSDLLDSTSNIDKDIKVYSYCAISSFIVLPFIIIVLLLLLNIIVFIDKTFSKKSYNEHRALILFIITRLLTSLKNTKTILSIENKNMIVSINRLIFHLNNIYEKEKYNDLGFYLAKNKFTLAAEYVNSFKEIIYIPTNNNNKTIKKELVKLYNIFFKEKYSDLPDKRIKSPLKRERISTFKPDRRKIIVLLNCVLWIYLPIIAAFFFKLFTETDLTKIASGYDKELYILWIIIGFLYYQDKLFPDSKIKFEDILQLVFSKFKTK